MWHLDRQLLFVGIPSMGQIDSAVELSDENR